LGVARKTTITIIGAGALARVLALALSKSGHRIKEIITRDNAVSGRRARQLAELCNASAATVTVAKLDAGLIWICVPDDAIAEVAHRLAERKDIFWREKTVAHSSGALPASVLEALQKKGASAASVHPLNSFVRTSGLDLRGVPFTLEGDKGAVALVKRIVKDLGGTSFSIAARNKPLYHAMGAFASPLYVSLIAGAEEVGRKAGFKLPLKLMAHILRHTTENIIRQGTAGAFSGPLKRGDLATLRKHLDALRVVPQVLQVYKVLSVHAVKKLPVRKAEQISRMMEK